MGSMIKVTDDEIDAYLAKPEGPAKGGVIVIHEVWGLVDHTKSIADRLAAEGYVALAPDFLGNILDFKGVDKDKLQQDLFNPETRNAIQPELRRLTSPMQSPEFGQKTMSRLGQCFNYLYDMTEVNSRLAVMGFCFGGSFSFNLAIDEPRLKVALPFYGHCDHDVDKLKNIKCPITAFYGEKDERLMASLDDLKSRMHEASVDFKAIVYPDCGHAFFNDTNPYAFNQKAAEEAWQVVLQKLGSALS